MFEVEAKTLQYLIPFPIYQSRQRLKHLQHNFFVDLTIYFLAEGVIIYEVLNVIVLNAWPNMARGPLGFSNFLR